MLTKIAKQDSYHISDTTLQLEHVMFNPKMFISNPSLEFDEPEENNSDNSIAEEENSFIPLNHKDELKI